MLASRYQMLGVKWKILFCCNAQHLPFCCTVWWLIIEFPFVDSFAFASVASRAPQTSGSSTLMGNDYPDLSISSSSSKHPGMETNIGDSADSKKPVLCMPTTHQHLSYVASMKSAPNYSSGLFSAKSPIHHNDITVVESSVERAIISSSMASKSNSKDAIRPFRLKSPLFTTQDRSPMPGDRVCEHSGSSVVQNSRIFENVAEPPASQLDSEEQVFMRRVKPASHHEPCLLKPRYAVL